MHGGGTPNLAETGRLRHLQDAKKGAKTSELRAMPENPAAFKELLPRRVCCSRLCAMPVQHVRVPEQAQESSSPEKN